MPKEAPRSLRSRIRHLYQVRTAKRGPLAARHFFAGYPDTAPDVQLLLARDAEVMVRRHLAESIDPSSTAPQLVLAADPVPSVRLALSLNHGVAAAAQLVLSRDEDIEVRACLAQNFSLTPDAQLVLSRDTKEVQLSLAHNLSLEVHPQMLVPFLESSSIGAAMLREHLNDLDEVAVGSLAPSWVGTVELLRAACTSLGPDPS